MIIKDVHHIAINTIDIDESIKFYTEVLRLKQKETVDIGELALVYIEISDDRYIELFDLKGSCEKGSVSNELQGLKHIALSVENIEEWNEHLKAHNVEFTVELCEFTPVGKNVVLFKDPNGVIIELCEDIK